MRVVLGLLLWTMAEISAFVVVGGWIGLGGVLAVVLGSGMLGVVLLRRQGVAMAGAMRSADGVRAAGAAGLTALAAVLLVLPGLLTDVAGLALLAPPVRRWIAARIGARVVMAGASGARQDDVLEGTAVEVDPAPIPASDRLNKPSGWTKP